MARPAQHGAAALTGGELVAELARIRTVLGMSQAAVARQLGVDASTISVWESGRYPRALDVAAEWARLHGHEVVLIPRTPGRERRTARKGAGRDG